MAQVRVNHGRRPRGFGLLMLALTFVLFGPAASLAELVSVRYPEGTTHGFLVLRSLDGRLLADGDLTAVVRGAQVSSRLVFRFKDGSLHDERVTFSQGQSFRVVTYRLIQKGPAFPDPVDTSIEPAKRLVTVRYTEEGKQKVETKEMDLPADLADGLVPTLLKNLQPAAPPKKLPYLSPGRKPRLVALIVTPAGEERFTTGGAARKAMHYVLKVEIGGLPGLIAPLIGKQPPDSHVWILSGDVPAFVRSEQPLYEGGPVWRIELASPKF